MLAEHWWKNEASLKRAAVLYRRARELDGELAPSIKARQREIYDSPEVVTRMGRFVSETENVAADVIGEVASVYTVAPRRMLIGATEEQQVAFRKLVKEAGAGTAASRWSRHSLYSGPVLVLPKVSPDDMGVERLSLRHHLGYEWDALHDSFGVEHYPNEIAVYSWTGPPSPSSARKVMIITQDGWVWPGPRSGEAVAHGLGFVPAAIFRASDVFSDYWGVDLSRRAHDATVEAGALWAELAYVRKTQNRHQLALLLGDAVDTPKQQTLDPELALELSGDIKKVDMVVDPDAFLKHIEAVKASALRGYGVSGADITFMSNSGLAVTLARRNLLRQEQIEWMMPAEVRLWTVTLAMVARSNHRYAKLFSNWQDLEINIQFPAVALIEDPRQREEVYRLQAARGATDPVSEYRVDHPMLSEEAAYDEVFEKLEVSARVAEFQASRQLPKELGYQTGAQTTGREGGVESGNVRRQNADNANPSPDNA